MTHRLFAAPRALLFLAVAVLTLSTAACKRSAPEAPAAAPAPSVATAPAPAAQPVREIMLGGAVGADNRVTIAEERFQPSQTVYVSVVTGDVPAGSQLTARWYYEGTPDQLVTESNQTVVVAAGAASEFHVANPEGWPVGNYRVDISLNGASVGSKKFSVVGAS